MMIARLGLVQLWLQRECRRLVQWLGMGEWMIVFLGASAACSAATIITFVRGYDNAEALFLAAGMGFLLGGGAMAYYCQVFGDPKNTEVRYAHKLQQVHWLVEARRRLRAEKAERRRALEERAEAFDHERDAKIAPRASKGAQTADTAVPSVKPAGGKKICCPHCDGNVAIPPGLEDSHVVCPLCHGEFQVRPARKKESAGSTAGTACVASILILLGSFLTIYFFYIYDTTVYAEGFGPVHNIGLLNTRTIGTIIGLGLFLVGIILAAIGQRRA